MAGYIGNQASQNEEQLADSQWLRRAQSLQ
jgi:hypothetical protein